MNSKSENQGETQTVQGESKEHLQFVKMTQTPIPTLVTKLSIPTVISMLVTAIYNLADTFFVSKISEYATAAVGIVFPIMIIIQAFGFTLGMGSGSLISRRLGEKKNHEASIIAALAFYAALFIGFVIVICGNIFSKQILLGVGSSQNVLPYATNYARFIFWGAPLMCTSFVLNNILRAEGKSFFSMIALTFGGVLNILLDPFFIFESIPLFGLRIKCLGLGITGAALATFLSQLISFLILISFFIRRKVICRLKINYCFEKFSLLGMIIATGFPSLFRQGLASLATILLNIKATGYGDEIVACFSIVTKITMFVGSIMIGIGQGFVPVSGYNWGAKIYDRVKKSYLFTVATSFGLMLMISVLLAIFAPQVIGWFRKDEVILTEGAKILRFQLIGVPFFSIIIGTDMLLQSTGHIRQSLLISCTRQGIYLIPSILILTSCFGLVGLELSQAVADIGATLTSIPYGIYFIVKLNKLHKQQNNVTIG